MGNSGGKDLSNGKSSADTPGLRVRTEDFGSSLEYIAYLRHLYAYKQVEKQIAGSALVLEVGCGEGYGTSSLAESVSKIIGLDIDWKILAKTSKEYGKKGCIFASSSATELPFGDNTFDSVTALQVIEHIEDDKAFVREVFRVLKDGGRFLLTTPNRIHRLRNGEKPWNEYHVREYYPFEIQEILSGVFSQVDMLGIRASSEIEKMEKWRLKRALIFRTLDPLGVRKKLPDSFRELVLKALTRTKQKEERGTAATDYSSLYSLEDFRIVEDDVEECIDLFGVCVK